VTVTVEEAVLLAVTFDVGEAEIVEFAATGVPATKVTVPVTALYPAGVVTLSVFNSATVDLMVPVAWPAAFVTDAGCTSVFEVPVDVNATVVPLTGLLFASRMVTVTVPVAVLSATTLLGETERVAFPATAGPATKVTVEVTAPKPPGVEILSVFTSATVETIEPVATPDALVTAAG